MARLKLFLTFALVLWFGGRSPAQAQTNDTSLEGGSGNMNIGEVDILSCCKLFFGSQNCYDECINIHNTSPNDLLSSVLSDCSPGAFTGYEMCINSISTAPTSPTTSTLPPPITPAYYHCCEIANTQNCTRECQRLILAEGNELERFFELRGYCGITDPIFNCFLNGTTQTPSPEHPPPLNGGWGSWTRWSSCSVTCGDGHRTRQRSCDNPLPSGGGRDCSGNNTQRETCNIANCPVNGGWGSWTSWSSCSVTCGDGHRTRQRSCDNPEPSGGGSNCSGNNNEQHTCSALIDCPAEEDCSVTEVSGKVKQRRNRTRFRFSSNGDPRATYRCKLDDGKFKDCKSPMVWKNMKKGSHSITVKAFCIDGEGKKYSTVKRDFNFQIN